MFPFKIHRLEYSKFGHQFPHDVRAKESIAHTIHTILLCSRDGIANGIARQYVCTTGIKRS